MIPKLPEIIEALKAFFSKPYTVDFPKGPAVVSPNYRGKPIIDQEKCIGCTTCVQVCPAGALEFEDNPRELLRTLKVKYSDCIFCGECERRCPVNAMRLTNDFDTAFLKRGEKGTSYSVKKEIVLCERCGQVLGTRDHLLWLAKKLGSKAFGNPLLIVSLLEAKPFPVKRPVRRQDIFRFLCSKCRHETVVKDVLG